MEFLFFLIVSGIFWYIQNKFGDEQPPQQRPPAQNPPSGRQHPSHPEPVNEDARTQRIQEEIRRKIAERRGQAPPAEAPPSAPPPVPQANPYSAPPVAHPAPEYQRKQLNYGRPNDQPQAAYEPPPPSRDYEAELAEQQRILAESERRASDARDRAQAQMAKIYGISEGSGSSRPSKQPRSHVSGGLARRVRQNLRNPEAAREAFLYLEILGTPVGQRRDGQIHPSWES